MTQKYAESYEIEHTVIRFIQRYLSESGNTDTLPKEMRTLNTDDKLNQDKRLAMKNSMKSNDYNKTRFDENQKIGNYSLR